MMSLLRGARGGVERLRLTLLAGQSLPDDVWRRRHRGVVVLLWLHVVGLAAFTVMGQRSVDRALDLCILAAIATAATLPVRAREVSAVLAGVGLVGVSGQLVHLLDGTVVAHFHLFVVLGVVALYQHWSVLVAAVLSVLVQHGLATISPADSAAQWGSLRWTLIHSGFVLAVCLTQLLAWRGSEQNFRDGVTGLTNPILFQRHLERAVLRRRRFAVLLLDFEEFKLVNHNYGHPAGDRLLAETAVRILANIRRTDVACRFGGDEFAVLLEVISPADALRTADRVVEACQVPLALGQYEMRPRLSGGVAVVTEGVKPSEVLHQAGLAMEEAKRQGGGVPVLFELGMQIRDLDRSRLRVDLARAVDAGEIIVHYQPEIDLRRGVVAGLEALVRWQHPRRGMLPPSAFIPVAEETGLILPIGKAVLEQACLATRRWHLAHPRRTPLCIAVNLSTRQFDEDGLVDQVAATLQATGLPPELLILEITETLLVRDAPRTAETLRALRDLGVRIAIDDFGTGYSSLSYLHRFPIDLLKIDRSFMDGLGGGNDPVLVRGIVQLGHTLGLVIVGEGVESAQQLAALQAMGCDLGQGYLFSRPVPGQEIDALLSGEEGSWTADRADPEQVHGGGSVARVDA